MQIRELSPWTIGAQLVVRIADTVSCPAGSFFLSLMHHLGGFYSVADGSKQNHVEPSVNKTS